MLFDTHCHLDAIEFDKDRDAVVASANAAGISRFLVPAVSPANFQAVRACCQRYPECFPAYGIHPLLVHSAQEADIDRLKQWLFSEASGSLAPLAVGEIGLDFFVPSPDIEKQTFYFCEQLKVAAALALPVVVHARRAIDAVLKHLRDSKVGGGIVHAFNGSREQADALCSLGFCLGFGGAMTYPGSSRIRRLAADLPLTAIVLETDAPDIAPAWLPRTAGRPRNSPDQLARMARVLAELRDESVEEIIAATTRNAWRCLAMTTA